jgi:hypothetical protein
MRAEEADPVSSRMQATPNEFPVAILSSAAPEQAKSSFALLTLQAVESIARPASELRKMRLQLATRCLFLSTSPFFLPQEQQCAETR